MTGVYRGLEGGPRVYGLAFRVGGLGFMAG